MYALPYLLFIHVALLVPGYVLVQKLRLFSKHRGIGLAAGYAVSIVFFALLATLQYIFGFSSLASSFISWLVILGGGFLLIKEHYYRELFNLRFPIICVVIMSVFSTICVGLSYGKPFSFIPDPQVLPGRNYSTLSTKVMNISQTPADDNYIPYRQAQFFVNRSDPGKDSFIPEWGVHFFQRTPLMGAVTANFFNLLGDKPPIAYTWDVSSVDKDHTYLKFQLISHVLNALFIVPGFFLLLKLFDKKTAQISNLFIVASPFFLYNAVYSWPKSLVAFFILISWLLLLEKKMSFTIWAAVVSGIAYLTHDLAVMYIGASVLLLLYQRRWREIFVFIPTSLAFALPWLFTSNVIYHRSSTFIYYPFETRGIPQTNGKEILKHFLSLSPFEFLRIKLVNFLYLLSPFQLFTSEGGQAIPARLWGLSLFSVPGSVGLGLLIPVFLGGLRKLRDMTLWIFVLAPVVLSLVIIGWPKGLGSMHFAEAVIVILTGLGVSWLLKLKNAWWLVAAFIINVLQLIFFVSYSFEFHLSAWLNIKDMLGLFVWLSILTGLVYITYAINVGKKSKLLKQLGI